MERKKKNDLLLCGGLCLAALFCLTAFWLWKGGAGSSQGEREKRAVIQLDGKTVAEFLLAGEGELLFLDEDYGALDEEGNVTLVQQYRYPFHQILLELPAGKLDGDEDHRLAAARELSEETGLEAGELTYLGCMLASPGFSDERLHMYLARKLSRSQSHPDDDEFLNVITMPFDELCRQVMDGTVEDAKTVATVLKTKVLLKL